MQEVWKDIKGYEGLYLVSNLGAIKNCAKKQKTIKQSNHNFGYKLVSLRDHKMVIKKFLVHRIVAETFIPNTENKTQVNHIDGNKHNVS